MSYNDESPTEWCERTWRDVWDGELVVRWEVETRSSSFTKWTKHETLRREHLESAAALYAAIERSRLNAEPGDRVRVLAWVASYTRSQVATKSWPLHDEGAHDYASGLAGGEDGIYGLFKFVLGLTLQGRDVGTQAMITTINELRAELASRGQEVDNLRAWRLDAYAMIEDLHDRKATREMQASKTERQGRMVESVVNSVGAKLLAASGNKDEAEKRVRTLLGSALADLGKSLTPEQREAIANALSPEQQLAFYCALLPEDGGHERLEQLQKERELSRPTPQLLATMKKKLPPDQYQVFIRMLTTAKEP